MRLLLASNNNHKFREMNGIISQLGTNIELLRPADLGFRFDCVENGSSFGENAYCKAFTLFELQQGRLFGNAGTPLPVISDDSGISVYALNEGPGVYSARFGIDQLGPKAGDRDRTELLLRRMHNLPDRRSYYTCNAVLVLERYRFFQAQETWHGEIAAEIHEGDSGFGYDPVFWLNNFSCTVAQLPQQQKDRISHRAKAVSAVLRAAGFA